MLPPPHSRAVLISVHSFNDRGSHRRAIVRRWKTPPSRTFHGLNRATIKVVRHEKDRSSRNLCFGVTTTTIKVPTVYYAPLFTPPHPNSPFLLTIHPAHPMPHMDIISLFSLYTAQPTLKSLCLLSVLLFAYLTPPFVSILRASKIPQIIFLHIHPRYPLSQLSTLLSLLFSHTFPLSYINDMDPHIYIIVRVFEDVVALNAVLFGFGLAGFPFLSRLRCSSIMNYI